MEDNYIAKELDKEDIDIIEHYRSNNLLHPDWLDITTYDMVQSGYPRPDHGVMVARDWGGTDEFNRLLPGTGMWCKMEDVRKYIENMNLK